MRRSAALHILLVALFAASTFLGPPATAQQPVLQVDYTPRPATSVPGTDGSLKVTMKNFGTANIYRIQTTVTSVDEPLVVDETRFEVGAAGRNQTITLNVPFRVPDNASAGFYRIKFLNEYCQIGGNCDGFTSTALVEVRPTGYLGIVNVSPDSIAVSGDATLEVVVENGGGSPLQDVRFAWATPADQILPLGGSNTMALGQLGPGERRVVQIPVATGTAVEPGVVAMTFTLTATDVVGTALTNTSTVGIRIGGDTRFDVSAHLERTGSLSVSVANVGVNPGTSVTLRTRPADAPDATSAVSFLGDLAGGDFTTISFDGARWGLDAQDAGAPVVVRLEYTDATGARHEQVETAILTADGPEEAEGGGSSALVATGVLAIVAVLIVLLVVRGRRRKAAMQRRLEDVSRE